MTNNKQEVTKISEAILEKVLLGEDLSKLSQEELMQYILQICHSKKLDPASKPFATLTLKGKKILYATKEATSQLSSVHKISTRITAKEILKEGEEVIYAVSATSETPDGRSQDNIGAVPLMAIKYDVRGKPLYDAKGAPVRVLLQGDAFVNAMLKAVTKAKRRSILDIAGIGLLDETEIESIPSAPGRVKYMTEIESAPDASGRKVVEYISEQSARELHSVAKLNGWSLEQLSDYLAMHDYINPATRKPGLQGVPLAEFEVVKRALSVTVQKEEGRS